jgi:hypothetical protein
VQRPQTVLDYLLGSTQRARLIRVLFSDPTGEIWLREIIRETHMGFGALYRELGNLERIGLVRRKRAAGGVFVRIDQAHPLCRALLELLRQADRLRLPHNLDLEAPSRDRTGLARHEPPDFLYFS